jgi:hypothetical protein
MSGFKLQLGTLLLARVRKMALLVSMSQNLKQEEYFLLVVCLLGEVQDEVIIVSFVMTCTRKPNEPRHEIY